MKEFLQSLKTAGLLGELIDQVVHQTLIIQLADRRKLTVTSAELQQAADVFRTVRGLHRGEHTNAWLKRNGMTTEDFERSVEVRVLERKLQDQLSPAVVAERFKSMRHQFDRARLAHILVQPRVLADELVCRLQEGTASFAELARE